MIYLYTFSSWFYTFILTPSKTVGLYVLEIPQNQSIHWFYLKTLDQCQFYHDQYGKSTDLGPISLLIVKYFNLSMTVLYQIQAQFLKFVFKKKRDREREKGIEKQPILKNIHKNLFKSSALLYCLYTGEPLTTRLPDSRVQILVFSLAVYLK